MTTNTENQDLSETAPSNSEIRITKTQDGQITIEANNSNPLETIGIMIAAQKLYLDQVYKTANQ